MFYTIPDVRRYVYKITKYRRFVITFFLLFLTTALIIFRPILVSTEELFWLNESKAYEQTQSKEYKTSYISRLTLHIDHFDQAQLQALLALKKELQAHKDVVAVESLFTIKNIYKESEQADSSLIKTEKVTLINAKQICNSVSKNPSNFSHFCDREFKKFYFYIYSQKSLNIEKFLIPFEYDYSHPNDQATLYDYLIYVLAIFGSIIILFRYLFKNYISSLMALLIISITLVTTMALTNLITDINAFHLSMALIVVAVALVDYLYFYYRWHVSQYKADVRRALVKTINRNIYPALWTSVLTILGLGALLFIDSLVIKHLSISVISASVVAYLLNVTLLPALLSFFKVAHPHVGFARLGFYFAESEIHYSRKFLYLFLSVSFVLMLMGAYQLTQKSETLFENSERSGVLTARLPLYDLDLPLIQKINTFERSLKGQFNTPITLQSVASMINTLHTTSYPNLDMDEGSFLEAKMFLQLYGLDYGLIDDRSLKLLISFDPDAISKSSLLTWLQSQKILDLYLTDVDSLMSSAKSEASFVLAGSVVTALLFIGLVMGGIFRSKTMFFIALIVNSLPMIWFGFIVYVMGLPLSIEALIAITISLALGSDASVHFAYKYYRSRFFGRSLKHSLEKMFFYAGVPVLIGSLILGIVFVTLMMTSVHSLQLIGMYGAMLMLFSLITDMFILPVLLIALDQYFTTRGNVAMLYESEDAPKEEQS